MASLGMQGAVVGVELTRAGQGCCVGGGLRLAAGLPSHAEVDHESCQDEHHEGEHGHHHRDEAGVVPDLAPHAHHAQSEPVGGVSL